MTRVKDNARVRLERTGHGAVDFRSPSDEPEKLGDLQPVLEHGCQLPVCSLQLSVSEVRARVSTYGRGKIVYIVSHMVFLLTRLIQN